MYCIVCSFGWGGMRKAVAAIQNQPKEEVKRRTIHTHTPKNPTKQGRKHFTDQRSLNRYASFNFC